MQDFTRDMFQQTESFILHIYMYIYIYIATIYLHDMPLHPPQKKKIYLSTNQTEAPNRGGMVAEEVLGAVGGTTRGASGCGASENLSAGAGSWGEEEVDPLRWKQISYTLGFQPPLKQWVLI